ncbi:hypothetical protein JTE90_018910 [Oedothorax gibbosus]|uniref:G-protein coupled receptors family 1 profile domain-containing protein n=1 Tax=Oedothorax gibbosus TaxID=931172 RepID=A0AAV6VVK4_9ARAC|nr:hypothetical protein JTE90_018910 [Oedothorax gibbosus]
MPLALSTTLIQNWVYGSFLCYLFPMMQDIPFHATMLTFLLIAFDRYRQTLYPLKQPCPPFLCMFGVYIATIFTVLPYAVYTRYLNLEVYFGAQFKGTGICAINVDDNIEEYIRGLFIIMYVLPLGLIAFLHIKTSEEIKAHLTSFTVSFHDVRLESEPPTITLTVPKQLPRKEDEKDWAFEKQMQCFLAKAVSTYATCLLPLNLIRLLKHVVYETYENSYHFDISFIMVVWLAFLPTVTTPVIFLFWQRAGGDQNSSSSRYLRLGRSSDVSFSHYLETKETAINNN